MTTSEGVVLIGPGWPFKGGIASHTTYLYRALRALAPTLFIGFRQQYPRWLYPGDGDRAPADRTLYEADAQRLLSPLSPLTWWRAARAIKQSRPRHIVIPWWHMFWAPMVLVLVGFARRTCPQAHITFLVHNAAGHEAGRLAWYLSRLVLRRGDAWIVHARSEQEALFDMLGKVPVQCLSHPAYPVTARDRPERGTARLRLSLAERPTLLFFGFVRPYKGLDTLLEALARLDASTPCQLLIAGEIWGNPDHWQAEVSRLGLGDRVRFEQRYIPESAVGDYFAAADLVMLPYRSATGSGVVKLAHSHGRPVVVTRTGALPDAVEEGVTGFIVPPEDPAAMAAAIQRYFQGSRQQQMEDAVASSAQSDEWLTLARRILSSAVSAK
ncbi:glycosyltransferase [Haliea atlantica]